MTPTEFLDYYNTVSSSIDTDDYFELMMRNAWHISGGEGWCANTTCRRVLVTHADGHQSVQEIKNDLGMGRTDTAGMMANLAAQGVEVTSLEVTTDMSQSKAILSPPSTPSKSAGMASGVPVGQERSYISVPLPNANPNVAAGSFVKQEDGFAARSTTRRVHGPQATSSIVLG